MDMIAIRVAATGLRMQYRTSWQSKRRRDHDRL